MSTNENKICVKVADSVIGSVGSANVPTEFLSFDEFLSDLSKGGEHDSRNLFLVTGPSGAGKSWLSAQVQGREASYKIIHIDALAKEVDGKWHLSLDKVIPRIRTRTTILEGHSDNLREVVERLSFKKVYFVVPTYEAFKAANSAKLEALNKGLNDAEHMRATWTKGAALSETEMARYFVSKIRLLRKHMIDTPISVVCLSAPKRSINKGWHEG